MEGHWAGCFGSEVAGSGREAGVEACPPLVLPGSPLSHHLVLLIPCLKAGEDKENTRQHVERAGEPTTQICVTKKGRGDCIN